MQKREQKIELWVLLLLVAGICLLLGTAAQGAASFVGKGIGPMVFPQVILYLMLGLCVVRLALVLRFLMVNRTKAEAVEKTDPRTLATYILILVYAALWNVIGFSIASFVYFTAQAFVLKRDVSLVRAALLGLVFAAAMSFLFGEVFMVNFPEPVWESILG